MGLTVRLTKNKRDYFDTFDTDDPTVMSGIPDLARSAYRIELDTLSHTAASHEQGGPRVVRERTLLSRPRAVCLPMTCVTRRVQRLSAARLTSRRSVLAKPPQGMLWPGRWMMCLTGFSACGAGTIFKAF